MLTINFVTTNSYKFSVAQHFFTTAHLTDKFQLKQYDLETPEIQADSVQDVALSSAKWIGKQLSQPVVVADAGLSIKALGGFPGPYMKYLNDTLTPSDVLAMMRDKTDRNADFIDALAYFDPTSNTSRVFTSITPGSITETASETSASTVDRLFVPADHTLPLAGLSDKDRKEVWNTSRWQELTTFLQTIS